MGVLQAIKDGKRKLAVVGLGYVGLPLALALGKVRDTIGFDIDSKRINALRHRRDDTGECSEEELAAAAHIRFSADAQSLR